MCDVLQSALQQPKHKQLTLTHKRRIKQSCGRRKTDRHTDSDSLVVTTGHMLVICCYGKRLKRSSS